MNNPKDLNEGTESNSKFTLCICADDPAVELHHVQTAKLDNGIFPQLTVSLVLANLVSGILGRSIWGTCTWSKASFDAPQSNTVGIGGLNTVGQKDYSVPTCCVG